jgi:hypothetical protein
LRPQFAFRTDPIVHIVPILAASLQIKLVCATLNFRRRQFARFSLGHNSASLPALTPAKSIYRRAQRRTMQRFLYFSATAEVRAASNAM